MGTGHGSQQQQQQQPDGYREDRSLPEAFAVAHSLLRASRHHQANKFVDLQI